MSLTCCNRIYAVTLLMGVKVRYATLTHPTDRADTSREKFNWSKNKSCYWKRGEDRKKWDMTKKKLAKKSFRLQKDNKQQNFS